MKKKRLGPRQRRIIARVNPKLGTAGEEAASYLLGHKGAPPLEVAQAAYIEMQLQQLALQQQEQAMKTQEQEPTP